MDPPGETTATSGGLRRSGGFGGGGGSIRQSFNDRGDVELTRRPDPPSPAPSALRRAKYSAVPYARSDIGGGGAGVNRGYYSSDMEERGRRGPQPRGLSSFVYDSDYGDEDRRPCRPAEEMTAASASAEEEPPLPFPLRLPPGSVGARGPILTRGSTSSPVGWFLLGQKKWREAYWVHVYPARVLVFEGEGDFEAWRRELEEEEGGAEPDEAEGANSNGAKESKATPLPRKGKKNADKLIKWSVDLDTLGVIEKKARRLRKEQRRREREERRQRKEERRREKKAKKKRGKSEEGCDESVFTSAESTVLHSCCGESVLTSAESVLTASTFHVGNGECGAAEAAEIAASKKSGGKAKKANKGSLKAAVANGGRNGKQELNATDRNFVLKYSLLPVRVKPPRKPRDVALHSFKLEKWTREGASPAASFASADAAETRALRSTLRQLISACERGKGDNGGKKASCSPSSGMSPTAKEHLCQDTEAPRDVGRRGSAGVGKRLRALSPESDAGDTQATTATATSSFRVGNAKKYYHI